LESVRETPPSAGPVWRPRYWLFAAAPGLAIATAECVQVALYPVMRAPNVSFAVQAVVIMIVFYGPMTIIPRLAWNVNRRGATADGWVSVARAHGITALIAGTAHLVLVTFGLAVMHSAPGWGMHFPRFVGEVWLGKFALWALVYALTAVLLAFVQARTPRPTARLEVRRNGSLHIVALQDVIWVEAMGNYVQIHTERGSGRGAFTLRETLARFQERDADGLFVRTHRRALVRADAVRSLRSDGASGYWVELADGAEAPLSRRRMADVRRRLSVAAAAPTARG